MSTITDVKGVDWGDDFALYVRQAKALVTGTVSDVFADNRFSVDHSGWHHPFSPYSYPWGWPLLIAPVYALVGLDYDAFKLLEVGFLCVFVLLFFALVRRRAGTVAATVLTVLIGLSPMYVAYTDTVLSDLPYLCFVGLCLWWMDRCRESGLLQSGPYRLVVLGLLLAYTYNIRREGLVLVVSLIASHVAVLATDARRAGTLTSLRQVKWRSVALPYATFACGAAAFQVLLPGDFLPAIPGTGLQNIAAGAAFHAQVLAEQVGLKDHGLPPQLFSSEAAGQTALLALLILASVGLIARLLHRFQEDVSLAVYLSCTALIVLTWPWREGRYILTVTPLIAYFAYQALPTIAALGSRTRRIAARLVPAVAALIFMGLAVLNVADIVRSTAYHLDYEPAVNGPESPDARQMFSVVRRLTQPDDVILFFRARAMTLYSDRRAVQGLALDLMLERADWYVMAKGSTYLQTLVTDEEAGEYGLTKAWENGSWVLWHVL